MSKKKHGGAEAEAQLLLFVKKLQEPSYLKKFMTTLEINKIEAGFQAPMLPMIFLKRVDEYGVVQSFSVNPNYGGMIPLPKSEFTVAEARALLDSFQDPDRFTVLKVVVMVGHLEHDMLPQLIEMNGNMTRHLILKQFDEYGMPTAYMLNAEVEVQRI